MESFIIPSLLVSLIASLWCLLYWWPRRRLWSLAEKIPGPRGYPLVGNAFIFASMNISDQLLEGMKMIEKYGPVIRLWAGPQLVVGLCDPDDIQVILGDSKIRNREKMVTNQVMRFFGNGLFSLRGNEWKIRRKLIGPNFNSNVLNCYVEVFERKSKMLVEKLEEFEGKNFNVYDILALCFVDTICETSIGTAMNSLAAGKSDVVDSFDKCHELLHRTSITPWLWMDWVFELSSIGRQSKPCVKTIHAFSEGVIAKKLDEFRRGVRSPGITTSSNKRVSSFLDMLIEASESKGSILSPEEMRDEITGLPLGGIDTTSITISFMLVLISIYPEVQAELHRELDDVFGSDDRPATSEDLKQLTTLERCIKETLRLFPVVPLFPREIDKEVLLPSGYTLPAGTTAFVFSLAMHRDARFYTDPLKFWPDRWLPENSKKTHPYAYIPFSAGPRNCIGQKYAQLQMQSVISQILRRYRVTSPLTMDSLSLERLEVIVGLRLNRSLKEQYSIQLHRR